MLRFGKGIHSLGTSRSFSAIPSCLRVEGCCRNRSPWHLPSQQSLSLQRSFLGVRLQREERVSTGPRGVPHQLGISQVRAKARAAGALLQRSTRQPELDGMVKLQDRCFTQDGVVLLEDSASNVSASPANDGAGVFIGGKSDTPSDRHVFTLGRLRGKRFTSSFRFKLWWMMQRSGDRGQDVALETQFMLLELRAPGREQAGSAGGGQGPEPGRRGERAAYAALLPLLEGPFRASLQGSEGDELQLVVESGSPAVTASSFAAAAYLHVSDDPYMAVAEAVRAAQARMQTFRCRTDKKLPAFLDHFGWCTWDAFYKHVNPTGIVAGLTSLAEAGAPPRFLIMDDGWQTVARDMKAPLGEAELEETPELGSHFAGLLSLLCSPRSCWRAAASLFGSVCAMAVRRTLLSAIWAPGRLTSLQENAKFRTAAGTTAAASAVTTEAIHDAPVQPAAVQLTSGDRTKPTQGSTYLPKDFDLAHLVRFLKDEFGLHHVLMWHALIGYWGGVRTGLYGSTLQVPLVSPGVQANNPDGALDNMSLWGVGLVDPSQAERFFNDQHEYLAAAGVDGVKVDVQSAVEVLGSKLGGRVALSSIFQNALAESVSRHFPDNACIACMSHGSDQILNTASVAVARASDDFWPRVPASHTLHVVACAFNSIFMGEVLQPDWDMFHSKHPAGEYHAAARAISGGPIYVSDKPGHHDPAVLRKLVLPNGRVLRARLPGRPTLDCLFSDPTTDMRTPLKVWNWNSCSGVVAAFNSQGACWDRESQKHVMHDPYPAPVQGTVGAADVCGFRDIAGPGWEGCVAVFAHRSGDLTRLGPGSTRAFTLAHLQYEVFTLAPVYPLRSSDGRKHGEFAPIGILDLLNSGGSVRSVSVGYCSPPRPVEGGGFAVEMAVYGCGRLGSYMSQRPYRCSVDGVPSPFEYDEASGLLAIEVAWKDSDRMVCVET